MAKGQGPRAEVELEQSCKQHVASGKLAEIFSIKARCAQCPEQQRSGHNSPNFLAPASNPRPARNARAKCGSAQAPCHVATSALVQM